MILIADSGGTKTDWTLLNTTGKKEDAVVATFHTQGITPIHQTPDEIRQIIGQELMQQLSSFSRARLIKTGAMEDSLLSSLTVFFYGSGCTPVHAPHMKQLLIGVLSPKKIEVYSDLMGAARGLCGNSEGIACILGTGANSCLYDGQQIVSNTPALGFILGDEGSGAVLGRMFLNAIFKDTELKDVRDDFLSHEKMSQADVIHRVYHEPMANRFLASTSLYINAHVDNPRLQQLVVDNFRNFFRRNISPYGRPELPVNIIGSMAHHYGPQLAEAARAEGFILGKVVKSPMEGLVAFHLQNC